MKKLRIPAVAVLLSMVVATCLSWTVFANSVPKSLSGPAELSRSVRSLSQAIGLTTVDGLPHTVNLSVARVSQDSAGHTVIAFDAKGDLPGSFTLTLDRGPDGHTITGGYWALIVSYTDLTPIGGSDNDGDGPALSEQLVQKGTLCGTVTSGMLTTDADGHVSGIDGLSLSVDKGSVEYDSVAQGSGTVGGSELQSVGSSSGTLTLTF